MRKLALCILIFFVVLLSGENLYLEAKIEFGNGQYADAIKLLTEYLKNPESATEEYKAEILLADAYLTLGQRYYQNQQYEKAKEFFYAANTIQGDNGIKSCEKSVKSIEQEKNRAERRRIANSKKLSPAEDYFVYKEDKPKIFKQLESEDDEPYLVNSVVDRVEQAGILYIAIYTVMDKIPLNEHFAIYSDRVTLISREGIGGVQEFGDPEIVFQIPGSIDSEATWMNEENRFKSYYLDKISNRSATYEDILVVEEEIYYKGKLIGIEKNYYARNFGLVRYESIRNGTLNKRASYELAY